MALLSDVVKPHRVREVLRSLGVRVPLLMDPYLFLLHPRDESLVWADYVRTRNDLQFLRHHDVPPGDNRVLVMLLTGWVYEIKLKLMLATGLRLGGWEPIVLLPSRHHARRALRYSKAFGLREFTYYSDFALSKEEIAGAAAIAEETVPAEMTFQDVKNLMFKEAWIGPQILSTIARQLYGPTPNLKSPQTRQLVRSLIPEVVQNVMRAERIIESTHPDLVITNEANYHTYGPLVDMAVARGIDVIQFIQPWRDDGLIFKRLTKNTRRHHPASIEPETLSAAKNHPWTSEHELALSDEFRSRYSGKWFLQDRNVHVTTASERDPLNKALHLRRKLAVIFPHVLWDGNLFYGDDLYDDYADWFVHTIRLAASNQHLDWLIKIHPANVWKRSRENVTGEYAEDKLISRALRQLPEHIRVLRPEEGVSAYHLFQAADFGITVRGTVGVEMPCFGKPVITAGTGRYSGLGFTIDSSTRQEYENHLTRLHNYPTLTSAETILAKRHALIAFKHRHWTMHSFRAEFFRDESGPHELDHNLLARAASIEEIKSNGDLDRWRTWAEDHTQIDYLEGC